MTALTVRRVSLDESLSLGVAKWLPPTLLSRGQNKEIVCFVACTDDQACAIAVVQVFNKTNRGRLEWIHTDGAARRQGHGSEVLGTVERWAATKRLDEIYCEVRKTDTLPTIAHLLQSRGWSDFREHSERAILALDLGRTNALDWWESADPPEGTEIKSWADLSSGEKASLEALEDLAPLTWRDYHRYADILIEDVSVALVRSGLISGLLLCTDDGAGHVNYARLFVSPAERGSAAALALVRGAIERHVSIKALHHRKGVFFFFRENESATNLITGRLQSLVESSVINMRSEKRLSKG